MEKRKQILEVENPAEVPRHIALCNIYLTIRQLIREEEMSRLSENSPWLYSVGAWVNF